MYTLYLYSDVHPVTQVRDTHANHIGRGTEGKLNREAAALFSYIPQNITSINAAYYSKIYCDSSFKEPVSNVAGTTEVLRPPFSYIFWVIYMYGVVLAVSGIRLTQNVVKLAHRSNGEEGTFTRKHKENKHNVVISQTEYSTHRQENRLKTTTNLRCVWKLKFPNAYCFPHAHLGTKSTFSICDLEVGDLDPSRTAKMQSWSCRSARVKGRYNFVPEET
jgi:hypothetical protein